MQEGKFRGYVIESDKKKRDKQIKKEKRMRKAETDKERWTMQ